MSTIPVTYRACSSTRGAVRVGDNGPLAPIRVYGPSRPETAAQQVMPPSIVQTTIHPELPFPGTADLVDNILAGYAYHLNVMPLDCHMPDPGALVRAIGHFTSRHATEDSTQAPRVVFDDGVVRVTTVAVMHGRATPALAYRFDTPDGAVVFSGDTTVNDDLITSRPGCRHPRALRWPTSATSSGTAYRTPPSSGWPHSTRMSPRSGASPNGHGFVSSSSTTTCPAEPGRHHRC